MSYYLLEFWARQDKDTDLLDLFVYQGHVSKVVSDIQNPNGTSTGTPAGVLHVQYEKNPPSSYSSGPDHQLSGSVISTNLFILLVSCQLKIWNIP